MSNILKENYKKLVDALAPYFGGASDFDELSNRPLESDAIDIEDLDLPMPAKPTEYPILFDETGTEYKVGLYKRSSDGKVKPIYRKNYIYTSGTTAGNKSTAIGNLPSDISELLNIDGSAVYNNSIRFSLPFHEWSESLNTSPSCGIQARSDDNKIYFFQYAFSSGFTEIKYSIEYTKTTDSWKEV